MLRKLKVKLAYCLGYISQWAREFSWWISNVSKWLLGDTNGKFCFGVQMIRPEYPAALLRKLSELVEENGLVLGLRFYYYEPNEKEKIIKSDPYERIVADLKREKVLVLQLEVQNA